MEVFNYIGILFTLLGAFLAFFAALIIFKIKLGNVKANRFFGAFLVMTGVFLTRGFFLLTGLYPYNPLLVELIDNIRYLFSPTLYFYVQASSDTGFRLKKWDVVHLLPLLFNLAVKWRYYGSGSEAQIRFLSQWLDGSILQPGYFWDSVSRGIFFICLCLYVFLSIRTYRKNSEKIRQSFPFGRINLVWIRILIYALLPSLLIWVGCVPFLMAGHSLRFFFCSLNLAVASAVFLGAFKVFSRPEILYSAKPLKSEKKYDHSNLDPHDGQVYFNRLKHAMEHEEEYTDPDLTLTGLAEKLSISRNDLSRIINEKAGKTFNDFVNFYRVEKFIDLLHDPQNQHQTLLSLAFQAGFNSKTPFNNAFKKLVGQSPVAYRKMFFEKRDLPAADLRPHAAAAVRK